MDFPLFEEDWSAIDEVNFLKGNFCFYYKSRDDPIPCITDVATSHRDKNNQPVINDKVLKNNKVKRENYLLEKKGGEEEKKQRGGNAKNDDNSDDEAKKQGKFALISFPIPFLTQTSPSF